MTQKPSHHMQNIPCSTNDQAGKRLFIGLTLAGAGLVCMLLGVSWLVPMLGFARIHPLLPLVTGLLCGGVMVVVLYMATGLVLSAWMGRPMLGVRCLWGLILRTLLPAVEAVARLARIPVERVRYSFVKVNNELLLGSARTYQPENILILLPHCIQSSTCTHRLTYRIDNCSRCGACPLRDVLRLRDTWGVKLAIASGGTIARRIVVQARPRLILAVACERDLVSGMQDTAPLPVFGIINDRPNGPCMDTQVDIPRIEAALHHFVRPTPKPPDVKRPQRDATFKCQML